MRCSEPKRNGVGWLTHMTGLTIRGIQKSSDRDQHFQNSSSPPAVLWESEDAVVEARPAMIASLDSVRHMLDEISPEMGVTDAASGPVVVER